MKEEKLSLIVTHHIFLTKEERYLLISEKSIKVTGISLPVWFNGNTGSTSEPAVEVFCNYKIGTSNKKNIVKTTKLGYEVNIPLNQNKVEKMSNEEWRAMTITEQEIWYKSHPTIPSVNNLRDLADGGAEYLRLEELKQPKTSTSFITIHSVEIKTIESLENSFI